MSINITISNKVFYTFLLGGIFLFTIVGVYAAYNSIPNPGHGGNVVWVSVGGNKMSLQTAIDQSYVCAPSGAIIPFF